VAVPAVIFVVCLAAGVYASSRWLPELAPGPVGGLSFFAVCGLLGAAAAVFGLEIYALVENLDEGGRFLPKDRVLAAGLETVLWQTGLLVAVALAVYLLAPPRDGADTSLVSGADPGSGPA
jgi:hypothetical protein